MNTLEKLYKLSYSHSTKADDFKVLTVGAISGDFSVGKRLTIIHSPLGCNREKAAHFWGVAVSYPKVTEVIGNQFKIASGAWSGLFKLEEYSP